MVLSIMQRGNWIQRFGGQLQDIWQTMGKANITNMEKPQQVQQVKEASQFSKFTLAPAGLSFWNKAGKVNTIQLNLNKAVKHQCIKLEISRITKNLPKPNQNQLYCK